MGIHGYGYYDTRTRPVNMRVSKIHVLAGIGFPFLIFVSYLLRVLSADIRGYRFFTSLVRLGYFFSQHIDNLVIFLY